MATRWKVYRGKKHIASCTHAEDAAALVAIGGGRILDGAWPGRPCVWTEGAEDFSAGESYDRAAEVMLRRHDERLDAYKKTCVPTRLGDAFGR